MFRIYIVVLSLVVGCVVIGSMLLIFFVLITLLFVPFVLFVEMTSFCHALAAILRNFQTTSGNCFCNGEIPVTDEWDFCC